MVADDAVRGRPARDGRRALDPGPGLASRAPLLRRLLVLRGPVHPRRAVPHFDLRRLPQVRALADRLGAHGVECGELHALGAARAESAARARRWSRRLRAPHELVSARAPGSRGAAGGRPGRPGAVLRGRHPRGPDPLLPALHAPREPSAPLGAARLLCRHGGLLGPRPLSGALGGRDRVRHWLRDSRLHRDRRRGLPLPRRRPLDQRGGLLQRDRARGRRRRARVRAARGGHDGADLGAHPGREPVDPHDGPARHRSAGAPVPAPAHRPAPVRRPARAHPGLRAAPRRDRELRERRGPDPPARRAPRRPARARVDRHLRAGGGRLHAGIRPRARRAARLRDALAPRHHPGAPHPPPRRRRRRARRLRPRRPRDPRGLGGRAHPPRRHPRRLHLPRAGSARATSTPPRSSPT